VQQLAPHDPRQIAGYRIVGRLGAGGMGRVYLGISPGGRPAAVKVARAELADDPVFRARFRTEVALARRVQAFCTAPVLDADPEAEAPWLATVFIPGPSLQYAVSRYGPLPAPTMRTLVAGLAEALTAVGADRGPCRRHRAP
jgi:serine/threonine protein kinase